MRLRLRCAEGLREEHGWQVPILVDAASGGFVAPFLYPDLAWDFRLKNVHSIAVSGHKCVHAHAHGVHLLLSWSAHAPAGLGPPLAVPSCTCCT